MIKEKAIKILKEHKISITENRILILQCLSHDEKHYHSIKDIHNHLYQKTNNKYNFKTIYNNINKFIEANIVEVFSSGGHIIYALRDFILHNKENLIHIANEKDNDFHHLEIPHSIFNNIKKILKKDHYTNVGSIQIFVHGTKNKEK